MGSDFGGAIWGSSLDPNYAADSPSEVGMVGSGELNPNTDPMPLFKLAPYDVAVWHRVDSMPTDLHERIIARAGREPDEGMEMEGFCDMHWDFEVAEEATAFAESLFELAASDDVVVLTVLAREDRSFGRRVYKDTRASLRSGA